MLTFLALALFFVGIQAEGGAQQVGGTAAVLGNEHVLKYGLAFPQTDVLERAGNAHPGDLIRSRCNDVGIRSRVLPLVELFHLAVGRVLNDLSPLEPHRAVGGRIHTGHNVEGGGLACAVGADQGDDLILIYLQVQVVHSHHAAKLHGGVFNGQYVFTHLERTSSLAAFAVDAGFFWKSSQSPMMPLRKNSTTAMMMMLNTTMRKPERSSGRRNPPM